MTTGDATAATDGERADLLETLGAHRGFLRFTLRGLTDEQAALTPTASQLCLGGLIKHATQVERSWTDFVLDRQGSHERCRQYRGARTGFPDAPR